MLHVFSVTGLHHRKAVSEALKDTVNHGHRNAACLASDGCLQIIDGCWLVCIAPVLEIPRKKKIQGRQVRGVGRPNDGGLQANNLLAEMIP